MADFKSSRFRTAAATNDFAQFLAVSAKTLASLPPAVLESVIAQFLERSVSSTQLASPDEDTELLEEHSLPLRLLFSTLGDADVGDVAADLSTVGLSEAEVKKLEPFLQRLKESSKEAKRVASRRAAVRAGAMMIGRFEASARVVPVTDEKDSDSVNEAVGIVAVKIDLWGMHDEVIFSMTSEDTDEVIRRLTQAQQRAKAMEQRLLTKEMA